MNLKRAYAIFPLFFSLISVSVFISPVHSEDLTVSTGKFSYNLGATIDIEGKLVWQGYAIVNGLVAVQVEDTAGNLKLLRVVATGTSPPPWKVRIVSLQSCDSRGRAKSSFNKGELAFFNVSVESLDSAVERQVTLALNVFDSVGFSLSVTYAKFSLGPGRTFTYFGSIPIPDDAYLGAAVCCASVTSELPANDGYPYCSEEDIKFSITGTGTQYTGASAASATGSSGFYYMSFKLSNNAEIGSYYIYTTAIHSNLGSSVFSRGRNGLFDYYWLITDIDRDGFVNIVDVAAVAAAFDARTGEPAYNRYIDIVYDGVINIFDIFGVAKDLGRARQQY